MIIDLEKLKLIPYKHDELMQIMNDYVVAANEGLETKQSCLKMHPSLLCEGSFATKDSSILSIDIGGTNIRLAVFNYNSANHSTSINTDFDVLEIKNTKKEGTLDDFVQYINTYISGYILDNDIQANWIGVSFSFPSDIIRMENHLDATRENFGKSSWGKGYVITESEKNITQALRDDLEQRGITFEKWTTLNDVIALKLAHPGALTALVVGTGYNIAVMGLDGMLYNTQSSRFTNQIVEDNFYWKDDELFSQFGISEVQISGRYLYKRFIRALQFCCEHNQKFIELIAQRKTEILSLILAENFEQIEQYLGMKIPMIRRKQLHQLTNALFERSTDLASAELAGAIRFCLQHNPDYSKKKIIVNADGSVIRKMPGYIEKVEQKTEALLEMPLGINLVKDSGIYGAAYASALNNYI